jgi:hypothetical protein
VAAEGERDDVVGGEVAGAAAEGALRVERDGLSRSVLLICAVAALCSRAPRGHAADARKQV